MKKNVKEILKISTDKELKKKVNSFHKLISESILINKKTLKYFSDPKFLDNVNDVKYISNFLFKNKDKLITNENLLIEKIDGIVASIKFKKIKNYQRLVDNLIVLKIVVKNFGLGLGRTQVRLNANQLNNAISKEIDLKGDPDDPSNKRTYLQIISRLIENVVPVKINFGSILEENLNARRYFMIIKQMFKYIDENQTIRFLIAECDYALTVMTALYFSKLFGVDEKIDISPLFETEKGLSTGHEVISLLLKMFIIKNMSLKEKNSVFKLDTLMLEDILVSQQQFYQLKTSKEKLPRSYQIIIYQM